LAHVRITRAIGVIGFGCVVGLGCAASGNYAPESYVVRPHDTLYSIAWRHDLDYHDLARWNNIGSDYRIVIGQVLTLRPARAPLRPPPTAPTPPTAPESRTSPAAPSAAQRNAPRVGSPQPLPDSSPPPPPSAPSVSRSAAGGAPGAPAQWVWPTEPTGAPRPVPGGGILLLGRLGQPVQAACSGRVVYVGNGLRGYGNLIIIKHGDNLLSAYAHTRELGVHEGQEVQGGQVIAQMGTGPHQIAALYFEIRLNGKPVDPLPYLPPTK
jgi:lipoprotein NlpD